MPELYRSYRAFISSPSDVAAEKQFAEESINKALRPLIAIIPSKKRTSAHTK